MKKLIVLFLCLLVTPCHAAVLYQANFDEGPAFNNSGWGDWNTFGNYCDQGDGVSSTDKYSGSYSLMYCVDAGENDGAYPYITFAAQSASTWTHVIFRFKHASDFPFVRQAKGFSLGDSSSAFAFKFQNRTFWEIPSYADDGKSHWGFHSYNYPGEKFASIDYPSHTAFIPDDHVGEWHLYQVAVQPSTRSLKLWIDGVLYTNLTNTGFVESSTMQVDRLHVSLYMGYVGTAPVRDAKQWVDDLLIQTSADGSYIGTGGDVTAPVVTIKLPVEFTDTYSTSSSTINISGTAIDAVGVTQVQIEWTEGGTPRAEVCTGTTSWTAPVIALYSGVTVFTVRAYDAANNQGTDTLTVTYTPTVSDTPTTIRGVTLRGVRR